MVELQSSDPRVAPKIHANMLSDPRDLAALRTSMKIARDWRENRSRGPSDKRISAQTD
jgi:choline dehydrogenase